MCPRCARRAARRSDSYNGRAIMYRSIGLAALVAFAALLPLQARAATDADLAEIREQIRQLKESYEARIQALEERLKEAEGKSAGAKPAAAAPPVAAAPPPPSPPRADTPAPPTPPPPAPPPATAANAFNPAISAVLQGVYANLSQDPDKYAIAGFVPSGDIAPAKRG